MATATEDGRNRLDQLPRQAFASCSRLAQETQTDGSGGSDPVVLHPAFVEALMGLPIGWTDSALSATEWSRYKRLLRSEFLRIVQG